MSLKWTDTLDIAIELEDAHPDVDPQYCALYGFDGVGDETGRV